MKKCSDNKSNIHRELRFQMKISQSQPTFLPQIDGAVVFLSSAVTFPPHHQSHRVRYPTERKGRDRTIGLVH